MSGIIYEQPLNERIRTLLRLDFLFQQAQHSLEDNSVWGSRATINTLIDIINVFVRSDLKTELIKELERLAGILSALENRAGVDQSTLGELLQNMERLIDQMQTLQGHIGSSLKDHDFLNGIRQRSSIPGGTCNFDLPGYHYWLTRPAEKRSHDLRQWLQAFDTLRDASSLILHLIRESACIRQEKADQGVFQKSLDTGTPYQLIRIILPASSPCYAEISGGKHRFSIRFMNQQIDGNPMQSNEDVNFDLHCCAI